MTREDMEAEGNELMIKACYQPKVSHIASAVFNAIHSYAQEASQIIGGMGISFQGLNKDYLVRNAKRFRNVDLVRYEPYIDMYSDGLRKLYSKKEKTDG